MEQYDNQKPIKSKFPGSSWLIIVAAILLPKLLLPNTGPLVLLDEFFTAALILVLAGYTVYGFILVLKSNRRKPKSLLLGITAVLLVCISLFCSTNLVLDVVQGEQTFYLEDCEVGESHGSKGKISGYYLEGSNSSGEKHRFTISREDYYRLKDNHGYWTNWSATVVGYEHTGRVIEVR